MNLLGKKIRELRKERRMTLEDLSKATGLTKGHLSFLENGKKKPRVITVYKICNALKCEFSVLYDLMD